MSRSGLPPQDAFDKLAEMFLSQDRDNQEESPVIARFPGPAVRPGSEARRRREARGCADAALNTSPVESAASAPVTTVSTARRLTETPPLRLHDPDQEKTGSNRQQAIWDSRVSFLYAGHLPVKAGLWIPNAASMVARHHGALSLARPLSDREWSVEVMTAAGKGASRVIQHVRDEAPSRSLSEVCDRLHDHVPSWLIEIGSLDMLADVPGGTAKPVLLLCGADPASIASIYRTLKQAQHALGSLPPIGLIIAGSQGERAEAAIQRLDSALRGFLGHALGMVAILPEIRPISAVPIGRFSVPSFVEGVGLVDPPTKSKPRHVRHTAVRSRSTHRPPGSEQPTPNDRHSAMEEPASEKATVASAPTSKEEAMGSTTTESRENASEARNGLVVAQSRADSLAQFVTGLTDLGVRCPKASGVEIAVDAEGRLHSLVSDQQIGATEPMPPAANGGGTGSGRDVIESLVAVAEWIEENATLMGALRSAPDALIHRIDADETVHVCAHIFTAEPIRYRPFLDGQMRIHLLARTSRAAANGDMASAPSESADDWIHVPIS